MKLDAARPCVFVDRTMILLNIGVALWGLSCIVHRLGQIWVESQKLKILRK